MPRHPRARRAAPLAVVLTVLAVLLALDVPSATAAPAVNTIIDSGPASFTSSKSATFTFHASRTGATFACVLDGGPAPCTSPFPYTGLSEKKHVFSVAATVNGSTDPTPATWTWTVDTTSPTAPTNLASTTPSTTSVALSWTAGTDSVGVTGNQVYRNNTLLATVGAVTSYTDGTASAGTAYMYYVVALDAAANASLPSGSTTATTPTSAPAPDTLIDSGPAADTNRTTASFSFHSTVSGSTFTCSLDGAAAKSCTSPVSYSALAQGTHLFSVAATANGLTDPSPATSSWIVDTTTPAAPASLTTTTTGTSVTLTWPASTDNVAVTGYDVTRDGAVIASVGAVTTYADRKVTTGSVHFYLVSAKDGAGNSSPGSPVSSVQVRHPYDAHLTRAPYLTDLVGTHVAVNFATDQSATTASVLYGAVDVSGACTPTTTAVPSRRTILVGAVYEYQWTAQLDLPAPGQYCYRALLGSTDLLGQNPSPRFTTQTPVGSTSPFTFAVLGDWGQVDSTGSNEGQANLLAQLAVSGAGFAVTVGDNGYMNGNQVDYGDLQQTATSAIFGPRYWTVPGSSIPLFTTVGNHGLAGVTHTDITTWTQDRAVALSGGRYQNDVYCCVNGSTSVNYGSEWYAFDVGNARFYVLDSAWGDTNGGTASPYANDALAHFAPGTPEYQWLVNDLATHTPQLKFVFSHYPFYSDNSSQPSDTYLQGAANLEGLLAKYGVQIVFNGHAHIYERNSPSASGMPVTYVTGGGGATLEPVGPCVTPNDAYAVGWSPTNLAGSACGKAKAPTSAANVFHFLKVTVSGTSVTVAPTDSLGNTFDVQTYTFRVPPDTYLDSTPPVGTTSTTASFSFHSSASSATYKCSLDGAAPVACTSPVSYTGLTERQHTFTVASTANRSTDQTPASWSWTVDHTAPSTPGAVTATATSPFDVALAWSASTDNTGVTGYDVYRNGSFYASVGPVTSYTDQAVVGSSTHSYAVVARDVAGNASAPTNAVSVTTPPAPVPLFADSFESGSLSRWSSTGGLALEGATVHGGSAAVEGSTQNGGTYAKTTLTGGPYAEAYTRVWFDVVSQADQVNLLRLRDSAGNSLGYVYVDVNGQLGLHDDATATNTPSSVVVSPGWHALELHMLVGATAGALGAVDVWLDGTWVSELSSSAVDVGSAPVGILQIGETQTGRTYDVVFDDVAFGTSRLGLVADTTAPSSPVGVTAAAGTAFSVQVGWSASLDEVGVTGYRVYRDGALLASVSGSTTSYTDSTVLASTSYSYAVVGVDLAGNASSPGGPATVTTPAANAPDLFADGFETGSLSAWTTSTGLTVQTTTVLFGQDAAQATTSASTGFAKKAVSTGCTDCYARVAFDVLGQSTNATLLRLRTSLAGTGGGYVFLTSSGNLAFRSDALTAGTASSVAPGPGWHVLELHLKVGTASAPLGVVEVWLDGVLVPALSSSSIDVGSATQTVLQVGDTASGTWSIAFDGAALSTSRVGVA